MHIPADALRAFLTESGLVKKDVFNALLEQARVSGRDVSELLVERGELKDIDVRKAMAHITGVPFVSLVDKKVPYDVLALIPEPIARHHNVVAFEKKEGELIVGMLDIDDVRSIEFIKKKTSLKLTPRITDVASIKAILKQYQQSLKADLGDVIDQEAQNIAPLVHHEGVVPPEAIQDAAEQSPVVKVVDALIKHAAVQHASDIHIESHEQAVAVRYRIDGTLRDVMLLPKDTAPALVARLKLLAGMRLEEHRLPQEGRFKIDTGNNKLVIRATTIPVYSGEKIVLRLMREGGGGFNLEGLGFHGIGLERVHGALHKGGGLVLVTGPTGAGVTTTLYTMLDILDTPEVNISTIEDPIEYQMTRVNQVQVRPEIGLNYASGLRTLLRQDADVIMVGEIRERDTAMLAVHAALSGKLVLAGMTSPSAAAALQQLTAFGVDPFMLTSTVHVVIAQRLVRLLKSEHESATIPLAEVASLERRADLGFVLRSLKDEKVIPSETMLKDIQFGLVPPGGDDSGYVGRKVLAGVLEMSPAIKALVMQNAPYTAIQEQARKENTLSLFEDGVFKAAAGMTTLEEVYRACAEDALLKS